MDVHRFDALFKVATGCDPFPFQRAFAECLPEIVCVPTGLGKTAMAGVAWLWRRFSGDEQLKSTTPRRLVYCLPMRVLVEQTRDSAKRWIAALRDGALLPEQVPVHVLMGGEDEDGWDVYPERDAVIVGTQDMLLSRALNRGYAATRARWPMQFGLLNTDCLWVFDEIQLMGSGLATTAQLVAFRRILGAQDGNGCRTVWMSATMGPEWLKTVDLRSRFDERNRIDGHEPLSLDVQDYRTKQVDERWNARKPLARANATMDATEELASEILRAHKPGTRTIVVVNTVKRACALFEALARGGTRASSGAKKSKGSKRSRATAEAQDDAGTIVPRLALLHSRFRPLDRRQRVEEALAPPPPEGSIIVSTQVIEAGVDVSATTLFTELAPWASLVQRFGRCNRRGTENQDAMVRWIDLPSQEAEDAAGPYPLPDLESARGHLARLPDVGLASLDHLEVDLPFKHGHVIRRKDLLDLFDTTPDLAGNDIDIDRYVREVEDTDVRVFWRTWDGDSPADDEPSPRRDELCPAPIAEVRRFLASVAGRGNVFRRDFLEGRWTGAELDRIAPGQVFLVRADSGGYDPQHGWDASSAARVEPVPAPADNLDNDGYDDDGLSRGDRWQRIDEHTDDVCRELAALPDSLALGERESTALRSAARWHDWGKAHKVFQEAVRPDDRPPEWKECRVVAKAPGVRRNRAGDVVAPGFWARYERRHFRHELASALAVLQPHIPIDNADRDLVAYLIAAHHGKVRLSIRSFPNETRPRPDESTDRRQKRFARGVWDGDVLPAIDLGAGVHTPAVTLSLEPMELGLGMGDPVECFKGDPSWTERILRLRDEFGPFRLAYLEAILRAADERASAAARQPAVITVAAAERTARD